MSLETATYLADLQPANPPSTDPTSQGYDHLRLIKQVLQTTFPGGSRTYPVPTTLAKTANYTIVKNDGEGVIYVSTAGGAVTLTLPTLAAVDQGWKINFIKTSLDVNPVFIAPAAGTLNSGGYAGLARARRCIPGARSTAVWDGAAWFVTRVSPAPIGCMLDFYGATLPAGFEWPNGQTLASVATNYPEYNAAVGSGLTPDVRGYAGIPLDNLGGVAAGRLPHGFISGSTLGAVGGVDQIALVTANLPPQTPAGTNAASAVSVTSSVGTVMVSSAVNGFPSGVGYAFSTQSITSTGAANAQAFTGTAFPGQTSTPFVNLQPSIMLGKILVVE